MNGQYSQDGYEVAKGVFISSSIQRVQSELLNIGNLCAATDFSDLDSVWNHLKITNRQLGGVMYNGFKHLPSVYSLAVSSGFLRQLNEVCGLQAPALVDVNCRIDSYGEEHFLFGWHQDFWFSVCSPRAVVVWIPITDLDPEMGGLEVFSRRLTNGRIFKTKQGRIYNTYADATVLNEEAPKGEPAIINSLKSGDALFFSFDALHRSLKVETRHRSRFTVQLRFADFGDELFRDNRYRPGVVSNGHVDHL